MNIPSDYVPLIVKGLEHYYAYTRAVQRDDSRYQKAAEWFQNELAAKSHASAKPARAVPQPIMARWSACNDMSVSCFSA